MALLQKIRNKAGVFVIIFVGIALFLFIIDPTTFQHFFQKNSTDIAAINGENVDYKEFDEFSNSHRNYLLAIHALQGKSSLEAEEDGTS